MGGLESIKASSIVVKDSSTYRLRPCIYLHVVFHHRDGSLLAKPPALEAPPVLLLLLLLLLLLILLPPLPRCPASFSLISGERRNSRCTGPPPRRPSLHIRTRICR